jgi:hypothetical protein
MYYAFEIVTELGIYYIKPSYINRVNIIIITDVFCGRFMFIFTCNFKRTYSTDYDTSPSVVMMKDKYKFRVAAIFIVQFN